MLTKQQFMLTKLAEESSEIAQIALKTQQFGMLEQHPKLTQNNKERIHAELNDLFAVVGELNEKYDLDYEPDPQAMADKVAKMNKYMAYSQSLSMVEPNADEQIHD